MMRASALALLLLALASSAHADGGWAVPTADLRLPLQIDGDLYARANTAAKVVLDFSALLPTGRVLADGSLALVDAQTGARLDLKLAQSSQVAPASGNPILQLEWTIPLLEPFTVCTYHLYLCTVARDEPAAWKALTRTFVAMGHAGTFETGFEESDPGHPEWPLQFAAGGGDQPGETSERVWSDRVARTGTHSLKIARALDQSFAGNANHPFWWSWPPTIDAPEGQSLHVEGWVRAVHLRGPAAACLSLEFVDERSGRLGAGRLQMLCAHESPDWQYVSGVTTAPPGSRLATLEFSLLSGEGEAYCDDVKVSTAPGGALPMLRVAPGAMEPRPAADGDHPSARSGSGQP